MSESVWFEEVDTALLKYIQDLIQIQNSTGEYVPISVSVRKPEEDFKIEVYPSITIYNVYSSYDKLREDNNPVPVYKDFENHKIVMENPAIPYNLFYQIDFWSLYQEDMNLMTQKWLSNTGRCFNLDVLDKSGKQRSSFVLMTDDLKKSDLLSGSDRIYHSMLTYRIYVELDENIRVEKDLISTTEPTTKILN